MSSDLTSDLLQFNFTMPKGSKNGIYSFDQFRLDSEKLMLYRDETELTLAPKIVKTLAILIENRGSILSKDELIDKVWDDSIVEESNLSQNLYILRKTLGTKPDGGQYIETLRRRGYRFNADVKSHSKSETSERNDSVSPHLPLIGREKEIGEVAGLLSRDDVRLVTVSGVGGVGKTSVARAVAERLRGDFEVFFVELAPITRPELVVSAIATSVGAKDPGDGSILDRIKETLAERPVMLVLDNFEQVASAAPVLTELVDSGNDQLKILATSRVSLRIKAETMYVLPPLQVPESVAPAAFADIASYEAVNLYVERAKEAQPKFELAPENAAQVASICAQLGGLPLAIELAAARMRFMSPEAVLKRLQKQLDFLQGARLDAPQRQQTMRETIAWSFDLLSDQEKRIFARLGVFSGGFDLAAAEFVCSELSDGAAVSVLNIITSLVEHNLLTTRNARSGEPRIYMLEVVREFAEEILSKRGENEYTRAAHVEYFLQLGEEAEPQLLAARSAEWLDRLEAEHDNLRAALEWSAKHDRSKGQSLAGAIWRFWWLHGHIREACDQLGIFLAMPCADAQTRSKMLVGATFLNRLAGNSARSRIYAEEGVALASETGDLRTGALSRNQLGFLALDIGDFVEAERMFNSGLEQARKLGDIQILALLNNGLGELSRSKGDYKHAAEFYGRALEFNREAGDRVRQTTCLINLGATSLMQSDRDSAGKFYRTGLEISSDMEDMNGTLYCLEGLAGSYWCINDPERASMIFGAANSGRQKNNLLLEPADQAPYEESLALVRGSIGLNSFETNFENGGKIGLKEAISLALDDTMIPHKPVPETTAAKPPLADRGDQVIVERQGNVLRLVDWSGSREEVEHAAAASQDISSPVSFAQSQVRGSRWPLIVISILILGLAATSFFLYRNAGAETSERTGDLTIVRLTNGDFPRGATISNDGNYFAYHVEDGDTYRLFVQQVGQPTKRELASFTDKMIRVSTFAPDGQNIYFLASERKNGASSLFRISAIGGGITKVRDRIDGAVSFSPDGKEMVFYRNGDNPGETSIVISRIDGTNDRVINTVRAPDMYAGSPAWSPDGTRIAFGVNFTIDGRRTNRIESLTLSDNSISQLSNELWDTVYRTAWLPDGRELAIIGTRNSEGYSARRDQVYLIAAHSGKSRRITTDGNRHEVASLGVSATGAILAVFGNRSSQMWKMDAGGDQATAYQISKGTADGRAGLCPLPDGRIAYLARSGDDLNIWVAEGSGANAKQIVTGYTGIEELRADPKGRFLIFSSVVDGKNRLFYTTIDGSQVKQITFGDGREIDSSISPDGEWIVYGGQVYRDNVPISIVFKMPASGGNAVPLTDFDCARPSFSPNGEMIACMTPKNEAVVLSVADNKEIRRVRLPENVTSNYGAGWMPDSSAMTLVINEKIGSNVWVFPIGSGEFHRLTNFSNGVIYRHAFSSDGTQLLLARGYPEQGVELITNYK